MGASMGALAPHYTVAVQSQIIHIDIHIYKCIQTQTHRRRVLVLVYVHLLHMRLCIVKPYNRVICLLFNIMRS